MANALDVLGELMVEIGDASVRVEARVHRTGPFRCPAGER